MDTLLMPPPPSMVPTIQQANGGHLEPSGPDRKTKKKNKKKEKRKEKRQQSAVERMQMENKLSVDPVHKSRLEYEDRMLREQQERELLEIEQQRQLWEQREQQILADIERRKQEEELRRLEQEEKKRQDAEEREVGFTCTLHNILCLCVVCGVIVMCICDICYFHFFN